MAQGRAGPGQALILTKPLGTGAVLAADMRGRAQGEWVTAALEAMQVSHRAAAECLRRHQVSACTDVTGFGLVGHLLEMLDASGVSAAVRLDHLPLLPGAVELMQAGVVSSLHAANAEQDRVIVPAGADTESGVLPVIYDPHRRRPARRHTRREGNRLPDRIARAGISTGQHHRWRDRGTHGGEHRDTPLLRGPSLVSAQ